MSASDDETPAHPYFCGGWSLIKRSWLTFIIAVTEHKQENENNIPILYFFYIFVGRFTPLKSGTR